MEASMTRSSKELYQNYSRCAVALLKEPGNWEAFGFVRVLLFLCSYPAEAYVNKLFSFTLALIGLTGSLC